MHNEKDAVYRVALTEAEMAGLRDLEQAGNRRGIRYKLDPGVDHGIVCCRDGRMTGFMTLDCFGGPEVESAAIAENEADWTAMATVLIAQAKARSAAEIIFIADANDPVALAMLKQRGLSPAFSEHRMQFDESAFAPAPIHGISIRPATPSDLASVTALDANAFGRDVPVSEADLQNTQMIERQGEILGKLRTDSADGRHGIYGVVVYSALRGQGIGAQAMTLALTSLLAQGAKDIYLEVETENAAAFHLYEKLGFRVSATFGYYPMRL